MNYGIKISKKGCSVINANNTENKNYSSIKPETDHILWVLALPYIIGAKKQVARYKKESSGLEKNSINAVVGCMHEISTLFEDLSTIGKYAENSGYTNAKHSLWLDIRNHIRHDFRENFNNNENDRAKKRAENLKIDSSLHTNIGFDSDSIKIGSVIIMLKEIEEYIGWAENKLETIFKEAQKDGYIK